MRLWENPFYPLNGLEDSEEIDLVSVRQMVGIKDDENENVWNLKKNNANEILAPFILKINYCLNLNLFLNHEYLKKLLNKKIDNWSFQFLIQ